MTKNERISQILKDYHDEHRRLEKEFWKTHGGMSKGKGDVPRYIFTNAISELKRKWKEIEIEFAENDKS